MTTPLLPGRTRWLAVAVLVTCAVVTVLLAIVTTGHTRPGRLDAAADGWLQDTFGRYHGALDALYQLGTVVPVALLVVAIAIACLLGRGLRAAILAVVATPTASVVTEYLLKPSVHRTLHGALTFPSGHATSMFALATTCAVVTRGPARVRAVVVAVAFVVAVAVPAAMVARNAHYLTDIIGGAAVGAGITLVCALLLDAIRPAPCDRRDQSDLRGATTKNTVLKKGSLLRKAPDLAPFLPQSPFLTVKSLPGVAGVAYAMACASVPNPLTHREHKTKLLLTN